MSGIGATAGQQANFNGDDQARWRPSDESSSRLQDHHHLCLMAKKSKKKTIKKDQSKKVVQDDDQDESDIEVEDDYKFDHLTKKHKYIFLKIVERNEELEEEVKKQEQSLHNQE